MSSLVIKKALKLKDLNERIELLQSYVDTLKPYELREEIEDTFRSLNGPRRALYVWQSDTITHINFLLFFLALKKFAKKNNLSLYDVGDMMSLIGLTSIPYKYRSMITLYFLFTVYKFKKEYLKTIGIKIKKINIAAFKNEIDPSEDFSECEKYERRINLQIKLIKEDKRDPWGSLPY